MTVLRRVCMLFALLAITAGVATAQDSKIKSVLDMSEFIRDWQISKQFTLNVANSMPTDLYSYKLNPEEMTFGEQMNHIALANAFRFNQITGIKAPFPLDLQNPPPSDKAAALKLLEQSFDYVLGVLPRITAEQLTPTWHIPSWKGRNDPDGRAMILNMFVHTAHHRAQCEVYMRAKGIKPPDYSF